MENNAVAGLIRFQLGDGFVDTGHGHELNLGDNFVAGAEGEHFVHEGATACAAATNRSIAGDEEASGDLKIVRGKADKAELAIGAQKKSQGCPIDIGLDSGEDKVELS